MIGTAAGLLAVIGGNALDDGQIATATDRLTRATAAVGAYCGRPFVAVPPDAETTETRSFPVPPASVLLLAGVDDLLADPAPVLTLGGVALTADQYALLRDGGRTTGPYTAIRALDALGDPVLWDTAARAAPRPIRGDLTITGRWGYADPLPAGLVALVYRWAARLSHQATGQYATSAGGTDLTGATPVPRLVDADLAREAQAYVHPRCVREELGRVA